MAKTITSKAVKLKSNEAEYRIKRYLTGIRKLKALSGTNSRFKRVALNALAERLHHFSKKLSTESSSQAANHEELKVEDVKRALPSFLSNAALKVAVSEGIRMVALYQSGLLSLLPKEESSTTGSSPKQLRDPTPQAKRKKDPKRNRNESAGSSTKETTKNKRSRIK